jgi:hypothetical protein
MEIGPTQVQSVQTLSRTLDGRTEITQRRYEDIGGKIIVQDTHYYIYTSAGRVEPTHKPSVDLHV